MLKKQYICKADVDDDDRTVTAVISTGSIDRDMEVLTPSGVNLDQYLKNPVVLWAHNHYDTPIAKALWIKKGNKRISAKMKFPDEGQSEKADEIYQLFKGGFLNAFSVGFNPTAWHSPTPDDIRKKPEWAEVRRVYDKWELLEFSAVAVPANADALVTAVKSKVLDLSEMTIEELGIENEEIFTVEEKGVEDELLETESENEVIIEPEKKIEMIKRVKMRKHIEVKKSVDTDEIALRVIKRIKGKMY